MFTNEETTFADIDFFLNFLSSFIFQENHIVEENNPAKKKKNITEDLDGIDIDNIGNLEDLLRTVLVHEECCKLKVFLGGGELTMHIK